MSHASPRARRPAQPDARTAAVQIVALHTAAASVVERLEQRFLLTADHADPYYIWTHLKPAFAHDLAIVEYNNPEFQSTLDAYLATLGVSPIAPTAGTLTDGGIGRAKNHRRPPRHKLNLYHAKPKRHHRKTGPTPPTVTNVNYYYDQVLPNQLAFTFDQDVTASSWDNALTVIDLNTGTTLAASGTYSHALDSVVYDLDSSSILPDGNYAAILHSSQITDTTNGLSVVGSDSVPGHDFLTTYFFQNGDVNRDRHVNGADINPIASNFNAYPATFSQGDANYDSHVNTADVNVVVNNINKYLALLSTPNTPTLTTSTSSSLALNWPASSDPAVTGYDLYRDNARIAAGVTLTSYLDSGLSPGTDHTYFLVATGSGNSSYPSDELIATTPPAVSTASFQYQTLPYHVDFTFTQDVTAASSWPDALTILNFNTGTTVAVTGATYSSASDSVVFDFSPTAALADGNYAAVLHASQITDVAGYTLAGSDGASGHDYFLNFFFKNADFNHDRFVDGADTLIQSDNFGMSSGATFGSGDANYNGAISLTDYGTLASNYGHSLPLLGSVTDSVAYVASSSSAEIFWDAPTDTLVSQYAIYRNSTLLASGVTDTGYLDTGLSYNTTYAYDIVGQDASGDSAYQSPESFIAIAPSTPTLALAGDDTITEGDTYYLGGAFGNANNDEPTQWNISWGDGTSATYDGFASAVLDSSDDIGGPAGAFHTYAKGTYTITGSALSDIGTYAANSLVLTVEDATPTFSVLGDPTFVQGTAYSINPTFTDFDSGLSWTVSWGDGSTNSTGSGAIPGTLTHTYTSGVSAPYTLNAYVTTADDTYTNSTTVDAAAPSLAMSGTTATQQGATFTLTESFTDPAGLTPSAWNIDWGDGSTSTTSGAATTFIHVYSDLLDSGSPYTIAAYAVDSNGTYYAAPTQVTVNLTAPSLTLSASNITVGNVLTVTNSTATNGGDDINAWTIAWGDGTSSYTDGNPASFTHAYTNPGAFTLSATASSADGNYATTLPVSVADHATFIVSGPSVVPEGQTYFLTETFSDSGSSESPDQFEISWGDGQSDIYDLHPDYRGTFPHMYSIHGPHAVTAHMTTDGGHPYSATASVTVQQTSSELDATAPEALGGHGWLLYPNFTHPAGQSTTYYVDWDDGQLPGTYTAAPFEHTYPYTSDPTHADAADTHTYTLTAAEDNATRVVTGLAHVHPSNIGRVTIAGVGPSHPDESDYVSLTATFDDLDQTFTPQIASEWVISWGDGTVDRPFIGNPLVPATHGIVAGHTYFRPGTYTIEVDAIYNDQDSPPVSNPFEAFTTAQVVVEKRDPSVYLTGDTSASEGDTVTVHPTFSDPGSIDTPLYWTIDWGDGASEVYPFTPTSMTHVFDQMPDDPIEATVLTGYGETYFTSHTVSITPPTVGLTGGTGVAYEHDQVADYFVVSRGAAGDDPLSVSFGVTGTASTNDYKLTDSDGKILSGSVTIKAGAAFATVYITPVDDSVPEWTETVLVTLGTSSAYDVDSVHHTASTEIVDNDLGITLGNGGGNIILQGSKEGRSHLTELVLDYPDPADTKPSAALTLTVSDAGEADIWTTDNPGDEDVPLLGTIDGAPTASVTYHFGSDTFPPETLWVGAIGGSGSMNDIQFTLSDSDAAATPAPAHPTTDTASTKPATAIAIQIREDDVNTQLVDHSDIAGLSQNWLVGQIVKLRANLEGPGNWSRSHTIHWDVPGNTLFEYNDTTEFARTTDLAANNTGADEITPSPGAVGTGQFNLQFFWVHTSGTTLQEDEDITLTLFTPLSGSLSESTTFNLYEATGSLAATSQGGTAVSPQPTYVVLQLARLSTQPVGTAGIEVTANAQMPSVFSGLIGSWKMVQLVTPDRTQTRQIATGVSINEQLYLKYPDGAYLANGQTVLDKSDPYGVYKGLDTYIPSVWITSDGAKILADNPQTVLYYFPPKRITSLSVNDQFVDYLMFKPTGDSRWVPLLKLTWSWSVTASLTGLTLNLSSFSGPAASTAVPATSEPIWTKVVDYPRILFYSS